VSTATERKQVIDELADRVLEGRREAEAEVEVRALAEHVHDDQAKAAFHAYIDARERYALLQADIMEVLPEVADLFERAAEARIAQEETLRVAQKAGVEDLPGKRMTLEIEAARENRSHLATDSQLPLASSEATDALAALARIRRMQV
jgi:hypothetical protein